MIFLFKLIFRVILRNRFNATVYRPLLGVGNGVEVPNFSIPRLSVYARDPEEKNLRVYLNVLRIQY